MTRSRLVNAKRGIGMQSMECDDQVVAAPRSAGVAKVVLRSHKTLLHAVKRDGSVEQVLGADSPELEAV